MTKYKYINIIILLCITIGIINLIFIYVYTLHLKNNQIDFKWTKLLLPSISEICFLKNTTLSGILLNFHNLSIIWRWIMAH